MTPQPPIDTPNEPTLGHAEYRKPELRTIGFVDVSPAIKPDEFNALLEKLREENKRLQAEVQLKSAAAWISVKDSVPPPAPKLNNYLDGFRSDDVLVYAPDWKEKILRGCFYHWGDDSEWRIIGCNGPQDITHWMPLPQPPSA